MTEFSRARPARLFTIWGTVLYVDGESGELRHGPIDSSPENAAFVAAPTGDRLYRQGSIVHRRDGICEPVACVAGRCVSISKLEADDGLTAATRLELVPLERGLTAMRRENLFLSAEPDGRVTPSRKWCSIWECFLASEDWFVLHSRNGNASSGEAPHLVIDRKGIARFTIDARLRAKVNAESKATKLLIYGYPLWSHGRVYYDLCKHLHDKGYIADIIDWQARHASYMHELIEYYDLFMSAPDGIQVLVETYGVPAEKIVGLSHAALEIRILIDQMGVGIFDRLAGYGVVGYPLFEASAILGVRRYPLIVPLGVDFHEFFAEAPERLTTVGYSGSMSLQSRDGVELKRGALSEEAAREAGLSLKVAGSTGQQIPFHDMPAFYKSVDALLVSSVTEGAGLPAREAAAAGRLVISTPVGDFPLRVSEGLGIVAPIESHKYKKWVTERLVYYKDKPVAFREACRKGQSAARQLDWPNVIGDWVELIETARARI